MSSNNHKILLLDAGSQFCKLIDRVIRELCVETEVIGLNDFTKEFHKHEYKGIIISGGPSSVYLLNPDTKSKLAERYLNSGLPILGICYGMQLIVDLFGGKVEKLGRREDAQTVITLEKSCALYKSLESKQKVLLTHGDCCTEIPKQFTINAHSSDKVVVSISDEESRIYGVQFHPEVNLTENGQKIFSNFLFDVCQCQPTYTIQNKIELCLSEIRQKVNVDSNIIILLSGGVDSTVCAALMRAALPDHYLHCIHVDHGFLRKDESLMVKNSLKEIGIEVNVIDARMEFLNSTTLVKNTASSCKSPIFYEVGPLKNMISSEFKRHIIGDTFMNVVNNFIKSLNLDEEKCLLVQGTLRPDLIESASPSVSSEAEVIKTHHNDTLIVRKLRNNGRLIEPLRDLHKDEVRKIGEVLKLPPKIVHRYPFPGPGLAIRILCGNTPMFYQNELKYDPRSLAECIANFSGMGIIEPHPIISLLKQALSPFDMVQLKEATQKLPQLSATLLPVRSVGIQGDGRSNKNVIALSTDSSNIDWPSLYVIAQIIPKVCISVNRVVFAFGDSIKYPINSITPTYLTPETITLLQSCDYIVDTILDDLGAKKNLSQFPVILLPIHFNLSPVTALPPTKHSIVLRPFISSDFMTGLPAIPGVDIDEIVIKKMVAELEKIPVISRVVYDLTQKPPGTTEWE